MSEEKKKKTIKIDKEDFDMFVKTITNLQNAFDVLSEEIDLLKKQKAEERPSLPEVEPNKLGVLYCGEIPFGRPRSPEELIESKKRIEEFRKGLEELMRKYRIGQVSASILKEL